MSYQRIVIELFLKPEMAVCVFAVFKASLKEALVVTLALVVAKFAGGATSGYLSTLVTIQKMYTDIFRPTSYPDCVYHPVNNSIVDHPLVKKETLNHRFHILLVEPLSPTSKRPEGLSAYMTFGGFSSVILIDELPDPARPVSSLMLLHEVGHMAVGSRHIPHYRAICIADAALLVVAMFSIGASHLTSFFITAFLTLRVWIQFNKSHHWLESEMAADTFALRIYHKLASPSDFAKATEQYRKLLCMQNSNKQHLLEIRLVHFDFICSLLNGKSIGVLPDAHPTTPFIQFEAAVFLLILAFLIQPDVSPDAAFFLSAYTLVLLALLLIVSAIFPMITRRVETGIKRRLGSVLTLS